MFYIKNIKQEKMESFIGETKKSLMLKAVYNAFADDISKEIYMSRVLFSLSDDRTYMNSVIRSMDVSKYLLEQIENNRGRKLCLYGIGTWGKAILEFFPEIKWTYLVDGNKSGSQINNQEILSLDNIRDKNTLYIVSVLFKYREVKKQLLEKGVDENNIVLLGKYAEKVQYFDLPELKFSSDEVFIDAGGFNGDTANRFDEITGGKYKRIVIFEPSTTQAEFCTENTKLLNNCEVINMGTWSKQTTMSFVEAAEGSRITKQGDTKMIQTVSIDEFLNGEEATFIKMDVEGAELESLHGAEKTIKQYKPKLAISIYHKRMDIFEIPRYLLELNADYKFFLRIYSFTGNDTVLYAI